MQTFNSFSEVYDATGCGGGSAFQHFSQHYIDERAVLDMMHVVPIAAMQVAHPYAKREPVTAPVVVENF